MEVIDLDILRPEKRVVKITGKEIDVSFVPCAITFDLDEVMKELKAIPIKDIERNKNGMAQKAFDLAIKECAIFAKNQHPEMDEDWFKKNVTVPQVQVFSKAIEQALLDAYKGVNEYGKK